MYLLPTPQFLRKYTHLILQSSLHKMSQIRVGLIDTSWELFRVNTSAKWDGLSWRILQDLQHVANLEFVYLDDEDFKTWERKKNISIWDQCLEWLDQDFLDICPLRLTWTAERFKRFQFLRPPIWEQRVVAMILKEPGGNESRIMDVISRKAFTTFDVFGAEVWIGLVACVLAVSVLGALGNCLAGGGGFWRNVSLAFGYLVGQGGDGGGNGRFSSYVLSLWSLIALVVSITYAGTVTSFTSLQVGYTLPFHDLDSMARAGYKFATPAGIYSQSLQSILDSNESTEVDKIRHLFAASASYNLQYHDTDTAKRFRLKSQGKKLVSALTGNWHTWIGCDYAYTQIPIRYETGQKLRYWPRDFFFNHASFAINPHLPPRAIDKLETAVTQLFESGNLQISKFHYFPQYFTSDLIKRDCRAKQTTRIRVIPFDQTSSTFEENFSPFFLWFCLVGVALVVFVWEKCWLRLAGGVKVEQQVDVEHRFYQYVMRDDVVKSLVDGFCRFREELGE